MENNMRFLFGDTVSSESNSFLIENNDSVGNKTCIYFWWETKSVEKIILMSLLEGLGQFTLIRSVYYFQQRFPVLTFPFQKKSQKD